LEGQAFATKNTASPHHSGNNNKARIKVTPSFFEDTFARCYETHTLM